MNKRPLITLGVLALSAPLARAEVINVPADQPTIQTGINAAWSGAEVVVDPGRYVEIIDLLGKAICVRSSDPTDPAVVEATIIDGGASGSVVTCDSDEGPDTVISGFTITNGSGTLVQPNQSVGGGMYIDGSSPTVKYCWFIDNTAGAVFGSSAGGGMSVADGDPLITTCKFIGNCSGFSIGDSGGGLALSRSSSIVINCQFIGNLTFEGGGGGMSVSSPLGFDSTATVINCEFRGNIGDNSGGGIANFRGRTTVSDCLFVGNRTGFFSIGGAGMSNFDGTATISNCTFARNVTGNPYGASGEGLLVASVQGESDATVINSIFWDNGGEKGGSEIEGNVEVTYSDVKGGWPGIGNIDADPLFIDPDRSDYRLMAGSPAIDAGNNWGVPQDTYDLDGDGDTSELIPFDLDGLPRFNGDELDFDPGCGVPVVVDMGAYEYQFDPVEPVIFGDVTGDGSVNVSDLVQVIVDWGQCDGCCLSDLNLDGVVDVIDLVQLIVKWG